MTAISRLKSWHRWPWQWLLPFVFYALGLVYIYASPNFEASDCRSAPYPENMLPLEGLRLHG